MVGEHTFKVAIDGVDGSGKTFFANELAAALEKINQPVIRASIDSFHNPRRIRYRQGKTSPQGFYQDSFNYPKFRELLMEPLLPGGSGIYQRAYFDCTTDTEVKGPEQTALPGSLLLVDGIFLHRPETKDLWDYSIFLEVDFINSVARCAQRDGSSPDPQAETNRRYVEGQKIYLRECHPQGQASLVVDNNDLENPRSVV